MEFSLVQNGRISFINRLTVSLLVALLVNFFVFIFNEPTDLNFFVSLAFMFIGNYLYLGSINIYNTEAKKTLLLKLLVIFTGVTIQILLLGILISFGTSKYDNLDLNIISDIAIFVYFLFGLFIGVMNLVSNAFNRQKKFNESEEELYLEVKKLLEKEWFPKEFPAYIKESNKDINLFLPDIMRLLLIGVTENKLSNHLESTLKNNFSIKHKKGSFQNLARSILSLKVSQIKYQTNEKDS